MYLLPKSGTRSFYGILEKAELTTLKHNIRQIYKIRNVISTVSEEGSDKNAWAQINDYIDLQS